MAKRLLASFFLFLLGIFLPGLAHAQGNNTEQEEKTSRSVVPLLAGYKIKVMSGIDSAGGRISKDRGLSIEFSIGYYVGNAADSIERKQISWRIEQTVNEQKLVCVLTKASELVVTFPAFRANFRAKVRSRQDVAEMLLMVSLFDPHKGYPAEPGTVEIVKPQ